MLADITCNSDGGIDHFIEHRDVKDVLELHGLNEDDYYLGIFFVGVVGLVKDALHQCEGSQRFFEPRCGKSPPSSICVDLESRRQLGPESDSAYSDGLVAGGSETQALGIIGIVERADPPNGIGATPDQRPFVPPVSPWNV